jgi:hypothetical protein
MARDGTLQRIGWTRGQGCGELAELLSPLEAIRIEGDIRTVAVEERLDAVVSRRLTSFDLVPGLAPQDFDPTSIEHVTAAVGDGPHSPFAVEVAARLASALDVPVEALSVFRSRGDRARVDERLDRLVADVPTMSARSLFGQTAVRLVESLPPTSLLVVGAPGGSWFQRQIYGPGHRLTVAAPAGVVMVRSAPRRCFHVAGDATNSVVGSQMSVADARQVAGVPVLAVADHGVLVGIVRTADLDEATPDAVMADVMEPPVSVGLEEPVEAVGDVAEFFEGGPIPVVDGSGRIIGVAPPDD